MNIFILYNTDQWCSKSSFDRIGIYASKKKAIDAATDHAAKWLLFEKFGDAANFRWALNERNQVVIKQVGYYIENEKVIN